jgi:predicted ArsR family transcriptional regulator
MASDSLSKIRIPRPKALRATGDAILFELKTRGAATAAVLARHLSISPQAVRQHLARLLDDGLVAYADAAAGKGRPKRRWRLTERAEARFPDSHAQLTVELIAAVRGALGAAALDRLIAHRERASLRQYRERLDRCRSLRGKVAALAALRSAEGYMADWRREDGGNLLVESHCPICAAAHACQGFCRSELALFRAALGKGCTVERVDHLLAGDPRCAYRIRDK